MAIDPKEWSGAPGDGNPPANAVGTVRTKGVQVAQYLPPVSPPTIAWDAVLVLGAGIVWMARPRSSGTSSSSSSSSNVGVKDPCKNFNCANASKKLENIQKEIQERQSELRTDDNELAATGHGAAQPGEAPRASVEGHYDLLDEQKANYADWNAWYTACCGGDYREPFKGPQGPQQ